jgi:hypothetical protein
MVCEPSSFLSMLLNIIRFADFSAGSSSTRISSAEIGGGTSPGLK